ncbi:MAG TPA: peptide deformylase, partial [Anaerolineae bacterium]|nr:peptide deformylase [Anaerolineae bacterium]
YEFVNPEIVRAHGEEVGEEGCLSIPGYTGDVKRAVRITIKAQDRYGRSFRLKAHGLLARVIQHEIDHLEGRLFVDIAEQLWALVRNEEGETIAVPAEEVVLRQMAA